MGERESSLPPEITAAIDALIDACEDPRDTPRRTARARLEALIAGMVEGAERHDTIEFRPYEGSADEEACQAAMELSHRSGKRVVMRRSDGKITAVGPPIYHSTQGEDGSMR